MATICALVLTFLCILQYASGRPDFGLKGDVVGSTIIAKRSADVSSRIGTTGDYKILLGSQYQVLYTMRDSFYSVADKFSKPGVIMADTLSFLANNRSGIVAPPFQAAISAVGTLQGVIINDFTQEFGALKPRDKSYITDRLTDSFNYYKQILTLLDEILRTLQKAAEQAQKEAGGNEKPVIMEAAREVVTPRMINTLLNAIDRLPGAIAPLIYSIHSPLAQLDKADSYITTAKGDIETTLLKAHQEVVNFNGNVRQLKTDTNGVISNVAPAYGNQQSLMADILPNLQASFNYPYEMKAALDIYSDALSDVSIQEKTSVLEKTIENYIAQAKTFDDDLVTVYGDRICPVMQGVVQVLIASGPYASYCYNKYSQRVVDLAIHNLYDIGECYELELNRLYSINRLITNVMNMVTFNFADLYDNLIVCATITPCPSTCDDCVDTLGKLLFTLSELMEEKFDLLLQIVPYEAKASLQRLKSCVAFSKFKLIADAYDMTKNIYKCEETGYH